MSDILLSVDGDVRPLESKLNRISSRTINLNLKDSISQPLGRITGKVSEFDKSLEASNARVLAFGASAGAVYALGRAFKDIVASTIEVEKSIADINVVLNASSQSISKFTSGLFNVAKNTGQSFGEVAKAATELARQGLGVEETLKRTNDALILTRLSGLDAATSVEALTAAVNSFARAGLTTTEIINKLATVDAAFAVSSADLANAISRVGSTAQDVGVDIDQLIAIVTAAQQTTARGGAVIGNSLKTIFTRLQRTDTLDALQGIGIAVKDLQGNTLPAVQILKNLSDVFYTLSDAQRASVAETVGGVFQINILRAALGDLSKEFSIYDSALKTSTSATNQAIQRNEALNQTLSALVNKTFVNLKEAAANVGNITIAPTIKTGLGGLNSLLESFNQPKDAQGAGVKVAQGILEGLGNYLSGPGLAVLSVVFLKIFGRLTSFSAEALKSLLGIASQTDKIAEAQLRVNSILAQNPGLIQAIISKEASLLQVENEILKVIQAQNAARSTAATISASVAPKVAGVGTAGKGRTKAFGFVPNFSAEMQEIMGAQQGGYAPGNIKRMNIPGEGRVIYNSAESVVNFPGASQPAIIPPENSIAGKNYKKQFEREAGFNPYAAGGFIPNFAEKDRKYIQIQDPSAKSKARGSKKNEIPIKSQSKVGMIIPVKSQGWSTTYGEAVFGDYKVKIGFPIAGYNPSKVKKPADVDLEKQLGDNIVRFTNNFANKLFNGTQQSARISNVKQLSNWGSLGSVVGTVFETAVGLATQSMQEGRGANDRIDFDPPNDKLRALFNNMPAQAYEAKNAGGQNQKNSTAKKILDLGYVDKSIFKTLGSRYQDKVDSERYQYLQRKTKYGPLSIEEKKEFQRLYKTEKDRRSKSSGFIPNFSALQDAIQREKEAGVAPSRIRVGSDDSLVSKDNPYGLGVYNTKDEPAGLKQGINRSKSQGFVPNFAPPALNAPSVGKNTDAFEKNTRTVEKNADASDKNFSKTIQWQGKLLAASFALEAARGIINQFNDSTSETSKNLNSLVSAISSVTTGLAVGGKYGAGLAGGMLLAQSYGMNEQRKAAPYTSQIDSLGKNLDDLREKTGRLDSVLSKITPLINNYSEELEQVVPDQSKIQDFRNGIIDAISDLPTELRNQVLTALSGPALAKETPRNISNVLAKEQATISNQANLTQLTQGLIQKQLQNKQAQDAANGFLGINKIIGQFTGKSPEFKPGNPFDNKDFAFATSQTLLNNILSQPGQGGPEGLAKIAQTLAPAAGNINQFIDALESLSGGSKEAEAAFKNLKTVLSTNDQAAKTLSKSILENVQSMVKAAQERIKLPGGDRFQTQKDYQGISKFYSIEDFARPEQGSQFGLEMYGATELYRRAKESGDQTEMGRAAGRILQLQYQRGSSFEELQAAAPQLIEQFRNTIGQDLSKERTTMAEGFEAAGVPIDVTKLRRSNFQEGDAAEQFLKEVFPARKEGEKSVSIGTMGTTITDTFTPAVQEAQTELNLLTEAAKNLKSLLEQINQASTDINKFEQQGAQTPESKGPNLTNTFTSAGGGALVGKQVGDILSKIPKIGKLLQVLSALVGAGAGGYFGSGGGIPNFAKTDIDKAMELEQNTTGKKAIYSTKPIPHVRNSSQPSFSGAIAQHGGIRKALEDSNNLQNSISNFAVTPGSDAYDSLERMAQQDTPEGRNARSKLESIKRKYKGQTSGKVPLSLPSPKNNAAGALPDASKIDKSLSQISKQLPKIPGPLTKLGKGLGPVTSALLAAPQYQEYKNQGYDSLDAGLLTAGSFIGGTLGGALGGAAGTAVAPGVGTVGGAIGGAIGGSLLAEGMMKALIDDQKIKPKINPKNYKDSRKPSKPKAKGGTLMIDPGDGSTETTVGDTAKNFRPQSDMFQFPMQSFNFNKENIPEIKAKKPGKLEKYAAYAEELKNPKTFEDVKEKLPDGRIITRNRSVDIANDVANIQAAEGYRTKDERINERRRTGIEDSGFDKAYLQWEQVLDPSQPNGIGWRQVPEPKVLSRNYNSETGMISNSLSDGSSIGLESEVRQKEKDIYLKQTSKRYAEQARDKRLKSAQIGEAKPNLPGQASNIPMYKEGTDTNLTKEDMAAGDKMAKDLMNAALNQKGKDKYNRTGFQNLQASNRMYAPDIPAPKMEWEQTKDGKNVSKIVAKKGSVTPPSFMNENAALPVAPETLLGDKMFRSQQKFLDPSKSLMSLVPGENELDSPVAGVGNLGANARNYGKIGNPSFGGSTVGPYGSPGWDPRGSFDISDRYLGAASKNIPQGNLPFKNFTDYSYGQNAQQPKTALENQIAASQTSPLSMTPMAGVEGKRNEFTETNLKNNIGLPESNMITDYLQPQNSFKTQSLQGRDVVPRLGALNKATQSPLQNLGMGQTQSPLHTPLNDDSGTQAAMGILDPGFGAENRAASAERFNAARNFALNPTSIGTNLPIGTTLPNTNNMFNTDNSIGGSIKDKMSQAINTPSPMQPLLSSSPNLSPNKNQTNINSLDSNMTYRDKKSGFLVSPTQEELGGNKLNMQSQPKDKSLEGADSLNQQLSTITENFSKLSEITKTFSETLNESNKKIQESSKSTESNQNQGTEQNQKDSKSQTVKVEPVTASVSVQTSPNTETEAKIAAIEAVIKELRSQLEGVKQKVTGNVDPPKK